MRPTGPCIGQAPARTVSRGCDVGCRVVTGVFAAARQYGAVPYPQPLARGDKLAAA
ncbi:hypothetical protein [Streptomyces sp. enrichment culture]|uniref:hypothetical protein n=1 Tax=Streptomyces sp. enrichment culture TaxID=1795815 RepID=UPI003F5570CF